MSKPTPRPWHVSQPAMADGRPDFAILDKDNVIIAETFGRAGVTIYPPSKANANYIVKCVNMHDELVTALSGAIVALRLGRHVDMQAAIDYGMEVLAKAQGGSNE